MSLTWTSPLAAAKFRISTTAQSFNRQTGWLTPNPTKNEEMSTERGEQPSKKERIGNFQALIFLFQLDSCELFFFFLGGGWFFVVWCVCFFCVIYCDMICVFLVFLLWYDLCFFVVWFVFCLCFLWYDLWSCQSYTKRNGRTTYFCMTCEAHTLAISDIFCFFGMICVFFGVSFVVWLVFFLACCFVVWFVFLFLGGLFFWYELCFFWRVVFWYDFFCGMNCFFCRMICVLLWVLWYDQYVLFLWDDLFFSLYFFMVWFVFSWLK